MYQANLSFALLRRYLSFLTNSGLLKTSDGKENSYVTTDKGHAFLDEFQEFQRYSELVESKRRALERDLEANP